jgi:hypothetical protein
MGLWASLFSSSGSLKSREQQETRTLYNRVRDRHVGTRFGDDEKATEYRLKLFYRFEGKIPLGLRVDFLRPYAWLLALEEIIFDMPEMRSDMTLDEMVELREALRRKERFFANQGRVIALLEEGAERLFTYIGQQLPEAVEGSPFTIPLAFALPNPKEAVRDIIGEMYQDRYVEAMLFVNVSRQIHYNLCQVSGIADPENPNKPFKLPTDNDAPLSDIVDRYLHDTPFHELLNIPVPLRLRDEEFFQHMHVLGGSGAGKTQLIQTLILHHIQSDASLVIIDSQGDLIDKVSRLREIQDRVILLTPKDIRHPPAINIFDINHSRLGGYDDLTREQVTAGVIDTFDYLFTGLIGADLTAKQGVLFRYIARLMLAVPETMGRNATILDMIRLMDGTGPYQAAVQSLSEIPRTFFERDFKDKTFDQTKEQIRYRLQAIIENPTLARLFTSPSTKVDLFDALNNGSIILVDTAKDFLKGASSHFGRIFISLVLQAVLERAVIPEGERKPAFLICDEAHEYFDDHIDDLLSEVRKYKLGCCFAHQHLEQCTPGLRASFAANTGIKMASGVSTSDARSLAPDMRTTPDFILSQPRLQFACHIRNVTPQAVSIPVEAGKLESQPQLSESGYLAFRERNRERVSFSPDEIRPAPPPRQPAPEPPHEAAPAPEPETTAEPPRSQRKRPKKRHGPLVGDIDTSA